MTRRLNLAMVKRPMMIFFPAVLGTVGGVVGGALVYSYEYGDAWASGAETEPAVKGRQKLAEVGVLDQDLELLIELTREGIENGNFGLRGRLVSGMRADVSFPEEFDFEEVEAWVDRNVRWGVAGLDRERSVGDAAVIGMRANGQGTLGRDFEDAVVVAQFIVMYGVEGEFPGLLGFRADGPPFVIWGILANKYDWRIALPD